MIKITIEDTENRGEPMVLTGELGFAVVKTDEEEDIVRTGSDHRSCMSIFEKDSTK